MKKIHFFPQIFFFNGKSETTGRLFFSLWSMAREKYHLPFFLNVIYIYIKKKSSALTLVLYIMAGRKVLPSVQISIAVFWAKAWLDLVSQFHWNTRSI